MGRSVLAGHVLRVGIATVQRKGAILRRLCTPDSASACWVG